MDHISTCRFFNLASIKSDIHSDNVGDSKSLSGAGSFFIPLGNKRDNYDKVDFIRGYGIWGGIDRFDPPAFLKKKPQTKTGFLIGHGEVLAYEDNKVTLSNDLDKFGGILEFARSGRVALSKKKRKTINFLKELEKTKSNKLNI